MSAMEYETEPRGYEDEPRSYERERSRSPLNERRGDDDARARSASPGARDRIDDRGPPPERERDNREEESVNPGSNLFVTGIHPRLTEDEVTRLFDKYGEVEKCNIMRDPHTRESRGFGFVKMVTPEQADAAKEGLQGEVIEGRTLSIEKARRARPRTPTPGKYFGPPKREDFRGGRGGRYGDRYDDRRGYGRRDDYGRGPRYGGGDSYDRGYGGRDYDRGYSRRDRDYGPPRGVDRYASGRDDRYGPRGGEERRGGGGGGRYYEREERGGASYGGPPEDSYGAGSRAYDDREPKRE
ncbi:uncharacterized protein K452DRAFT_298326 [Aplosporella prunicola CBS 121167]|uniref:RRM domain-containing protein n=1 Tax=Aplosporella prunicola CBS 121167 TaxID=1176127 RepID=A0A6A6BGI6_9PEZI|nr:uncharacterized protein K452DRAFT_298326 [Aplosporella prunicola CBS 121167]KAF2141641.1 hypothetical protein K452DRAFT_298326 [Aplosporella prunicola CBS 121167]